MESQPSDFSECEERLGAIIFAWLRANEEGQPVDREELLRDHPEFAEELAEFLAGRDEFEHLVGPLRTGQEAILSNPDTDPLPPALPRVFGDYELLEEVGRGGMGVVYRALQRSLGRQVAVKVLPATVTLDPTQQVRFQHEARILASLKHPHIVPVFGMGCEQGVSYYAMQLIEGQTLAALLQQQRQAQEDANAGGRETPVSRSLVDTPSQLQDLACTVSLPADKGHEVGTSLKVPSTGLAYMWEVACWGVQAAEALEHAHQVRVWHRDIKPGNLILDGYGNVWVTDFGLAHWQGEGNLTLTGDLVGTLRYMSPEQALGQREGVDHRTDIYSLGVTLYELLTRQPPFTSSNRQQLLRQIIHEEPVPPCRRNREVPHDLGTIVLKALEKSPGERYASAQELADDLTRFLHDEPIRARRPTAWQRARKWVRRHRSVVTAAAAVLVGMSLLMGSLFLMGVIQLASWSHQERDPFDSLVLGESSNKTVRVGDVTGAGTSPSQPAGREREAPCGPEPLIFTGHTGGVGCVTFSPDGTHLASGSNDNTVQIWDLHTQRVRFILTGHTSGVESVCFSPDGTRLASASRDGTVRIWHALKGTLSRTLQGHTGSVWRVLFSPDGKRLASASEDKTVRVWDARTGEPIRLFEKSSCGVWGLAFSPDGEELAAPTDREGMVTVWEVETGKELLALSGHGAFACCVCFSPNDKFIATGSVDHIVKVWDAGTGKELLSLADHSGVVWGARSALMASGSPR